MAAEEGERVIARMRQAATVIDNGVNEMQSKYDQIIARMADEMLSSQASSYKDCCALFSPRAHTFGNDLIILKLTKCCPGSNPTLETRSPAKDASNREREPCSPQEIAETREAASSVVTVFLLFRLLSLVLRQRQQQR